MISDLGVIIAAGGSSQRYGEKDKLLEELAGLPVFLHSVRNFMPFTAPGNLVVAVRSSALDDYRRIAEKFFPGNPVVWVPGGIDRIASVRNALDALPVSDGLVAVHDAARPLASGRLLERVVARARITGGAIAGAKVTDSLKLSGTDGMIRMPVSREMVYRAETPQVFDIAKYRHACAILQDSTPTDDAEIMRLAGFPVALVESGELNLKLTAPDDLIKLQQIFSGGRVWEK